MRWPESSLPIGMIRSKPHLINFADGFGELILDSVRYLGNNEIMKAIDLRQALKSHYEGWVAINTKNRKVVAKAKTFASISEKAKGLKDVLLVPGSNNYFGFVTSLNA